MAATIQIQTTTGSNILTFAAAILGSSPTITPNGFPVATMIKIIGNGGDEIRVTGNINLGAGGIPTGGTVTGLSMRDNGNAYATVTNFSANAVDFYNAMTGGTPADLLNLVGDIRFIGNNGIDFGAGAIGNDDLRGGLADDELYGFDGNDIIDGGGGGDLLRGGNDTDTLTYERSAAAVTVNLQNGNAIGGDATGDNFSGFENLTGSKFDDKLAGNGLDNEISGLDANDTLRGGGGADHLIGGAGLDTADYTGSAAGVTVNLGADTASGGDAAGDTLDGIENLIGSNNADTLTGDGGPNTIDGRGGNDHIFGGGDKDRLFGGNGDDRISGGQGVDRDTGGAGADTFVLERSAANREIIMDYVAIDDTLEIRAAVFGGGLIGGNALAANQFEINLTGEATAATTRFILDSDDGVLWFDVNGSANGTGGSRIVAVFDAGAPPLTLDDFSVV